MMPPAPARRTARLALLAGLALGAAPPPAADPLDAVLALPRTASLAGAAAAPRFAWIDEADGLAALWTALPGAPPQRLAIAASEGEPLADVALAPDGAAIAFTRGGDEEFPDAPPNADRLATPPAAEVWRVAATGGVPLRIGAGHDPLFSPDGTRIAFLARHALWLWRAESGAERIATLPGTPVQLRWSPDGTRLAFVEARDGHDLLGLIRPGDPRIDYLDTGFDKAWEPVFSADGRSLAYLRVATPPADAAPDAGGWWSVAIADLARGTSRTVWRAPAGPGGRFQGLAGSSLAWLADGTLILPWEAGGWLHLWAIDPAGRAAPRDLTPGIGEVESLRVAADGRSLAFASNAGDAERRHVWRLVPGAGPARRIGTGQGLETAPAFAGDRLALIAADARHPGYPALAATGLPPLRPPAIAPAGPMPRPVLFTAADGMTVHGVYFPPAGAGPHPALVFVHGGPRRQMLLGYHPLGYYARAYAFNRHLAASGYAVLAVNYRSGTGYGLRFREAPGIGRAGAAEYQDVRAAGQWLAARPEVDARRLGLWGGSWGGYLTALALARDSALFAAGADFHGVHTLVRPPDPGLSPEAGAAAQRVQWQASPLAAVARWRSPVLLVHGDDDRNVDFGQSLLLARALTARGVPVRTLVLPDERHGFLRLADWRAAYHATQAFFDATLATPPRSDP
ncbi:S9 family peptidase [Sphingomonas morindae]|uniref:Acyl-peptide hydrolase n=1 Tax=Sphingomonas morindae TaxID=1541170 RepID=A0ABY4XDN3_9SPHN|nr:prolyl oligopeptidase family serine peptidase [Sphingomonas morindae]USI74958.1 prolyl oligopeptidase family serine peptidase [Sphingomonas morindae]